MGNEILIDLLKTFDPEHPNFRPTELYNEGWLLRIVLNEYSNHRITNQLLSFQQGATWFSEAMLPTKFTARKDIGRSDPLAESRTNADGVMGHIEIGNEGKADLELADNASQFIVIEAKMNSKLTEYVSNVPGYDQAARTVACMAESLRRKNIHPDKMESFGYYVLAPEKRIGNSNFKKLVDECSIKDAVRKRVDGYKDETEYKKYDDWFKNWFEPTLEKIELDVISWETVIEQLPDGAKKKVDNFYQQCLKHN